MRNTQLLSDTTLLRDWWDVSAVLRADNAGISLAPLVASAAAHEGLHSFHNHDP